MESAGAIFVRLVMNIRQKLQGSSVPIGLPLTAVLILYAYRRLRAPKTRLVNWCGDHEAQPASLHFPQTEGEIRAIVLEAQQRNERVKVGGGLHSWSHIAMPAKGVQTQFILLDRFNHVVHLDENARTITVEARCPSTGAEI